MHSINPSIGVYIVNQDDRVYTRYWVKKMLATFLSDLSEDSKRYTLTCKNFRYLSIEDIKPLENDVSIVILPTRTYEFKLLEHSGHIVIIVSLHPGNGVYSNGLSYPQLSLIQRYLLWKSPLDIKARPYANLKADGKALIIACASKFNPSDLSVLFNKARKIKTDISIKDALLRIIPLKRKQAKLIGENNVV